MLEENNKERIEDNTKEKEERESIMMAIEYLEEANDPRLNHAIEILKKNISDNYVYKIKADENGNMIKYR